MIKWGIFLRCLRAHQALLVGTILIVSLASALSAIVIGSSYWNSAVAKASDVNILRVANALSASHFLPLRYMDSIKQIAEVEFITEVSSAASILPGKNDYVGLTVVTKDDLDKIFPELKISEHARSEWASLKAGALVSTSIYEELNLSEDKLLPIILISVGGRQSAEIVVAGTFNPTSTLGCANCIFVGRDFIDSHLPGYKGLVSSYLVKAHANFDSMEVAKEIDSLFSAEAYPTETTDIASAVSSSQRDMFDLRYLALIMFCFVGASLLLVPFLALLITGFRLQPIVALIYVLGYTRGSIRLWIYCVAFALTIISGTSGYLLVHIVNISHSTYMPWLIINHEGFALTAAILTSFIGIFFAALLIDFALGRVSVEKLTEEL